MGKKYVFTLNEITGMIAVRILLSILNRIQGASYRQLGGKGQIVFLRTVVKPPQNGLVFLATTT